MNNVAITFDTTNCLLRTMYFKGSSLICKDFELDKDCFANNDISPKTFAPLSNISVPTNLVCVLPDDFVACSYIEIPSVAAKKRAESLVRLELSSRFKQIERYKVLLVSKATIDTSKMAYFAYLTDGEQVDGIISAVKHYRFASKKVSFASAMTANALCAIGLICKHENVMFADIKSNYTRVIAIADMIPIGFTTIPYGSDYLFGNSPLIGSAERTTENQDRNNLKRLLRLLEEMRDTLGGKYHIPNISIRLHTAIEVALPKDMLEDYGRIEQIVIKDKLIAENLELFGAMNNKFIGKGLLF